LYIAGRYDDAYQAFRQYLRLSAEYRKSSGESSMPYLPSQLKADLSFKGRLQASSRSFEEARKTAEELKSLIDKGMNAKELRWYEDILGLIELGRKNYPQAAEYFKRACGRLYYEALIPETFEHAALFDYLARALYESGDFDGARGEYEKITSLTIGKVGNGDIYAKAFYMLGKIAEQQNDEVNARERYTKFLDLWKDADPGLPEVEDSKMRLAGLKTP
jgi:tetratricopeptide (TPR) repeat protein